MSATLFVILATICLLGTTSTAAIVVRRKRLGHKTTARALLTSGDFHAPGWGIERTREGILLTKTIGEDQALRVQIHAILEGKSMLRVRVQREHGNAPARISVTARDLAQRVDLDQDGGASLTLSPSAPVTLTIDNEQLHTTLGALGECALVIQQHGVDPAMVRFEPAWAELSQESLVFGGEHFGELFDAEGIAHLERYIMTFARMFAWGPQTDLRDVLRATFTTTSHFHSQIAAKRLYGELLSGEEQEAFWVDCVLHAPGEERLSRYAFRRLVEGGKKERLASALRGQNVELHRWLVMQDEVPAILWMIEDEQQQAKWLDFIMIRVGPRPMFSDEHSQRRRRAKIERACAMLERIPLELLCSPHVHPSTRSYLIDFARRHWYGYSSAKLCVSMARNLHGRDLEAFLDAVVFPYSEHGAATLASVMARHTPPTPAIQAFILRHLMPLHERYAGIFQEFDHLPCLHRMLSDDDPEVRHNALAITRDIGDRTTLMALIALRKADRVALDGDALDFAIKKLFDIYGADLEQNAGQLSLAEAQGGELTAVQVGGGELSVVDAGR